MVPMRHPIPLPSPINRIFRQWCPSFSDTPREHDSQFLVAMVADRTPQKLPGSKHHEVSPVC